MRYKSVHIPVQRLEDFLAEFDSSQAGGSGKYFGWEIAFMFVELHASPISQEPTPVYRAILKSD